jgi:hypothetical protein
MIRGDAAVCRRQRRDEVSELEGVGRRAVNKDEGRARAGVYVMNAAVT